MGHSRKFYWLAAHGFGHGKHASLPYQNSGPVRYGRPDQIRVNKQHITQIHRRSNLIVPLVSELLFSMVAGLEGLTMAHCIRRQD